MILEIKNISISLEQNQEKVLIKHVEKLGIKKELINNLSLTKKSIDSRNRRDIKLIYNIELSLNKAVDISKMKDTFFKKENEKIERKSKKVEGNIAVIGTGPAGLFAGWRTG